MVALEETQIQTDGGQSFKVGAVERTTERFFSSIVDDEHRSKGEALDFVEGRALSPSEFSHPTGGVNAPADEDYCGWLAEDI